MGERVLNTIEYMDRLVEVGVPEKQAKAHILIFHDFMSSNLATKKDIAEIKRDIAELGNKTERDIAELGNKTERDIAELGNKTERDIAELGNKTERDIAELGNKTERDIAEIKKDIAQLQRDTQRDIETMGYRMTIWLGGIVAASAMFILGAIFTMGRMGLLQAIPN